MANWLTISGPTALDVPNPKKRENLKNEWRYCGIPDGKKWKNVKDAAKREEGTI